MAILRLATALATALLAACYAPELRDCTVTCTGSTDCAGDQVCGGDGYCAAPEVAGSCGAGSGSEPPKLALRAMVAGRGSLEIAGIGTCVADCTWQVVAGTTVQARAIDGEQKFERWTTATCTARVPTCTLTLTAAAIIGVKFH